MTDILDSVTYLPAPGVNLSEVCQASVVEFIRAIRHERDMDDAVATAAAIVIILIAKNRGADFPSVSRRINETMRRVHREWGGYL